MIRAYLNKANGFHFFQWGFTLIRFPIDCVLLFGHHVAMNGSHELVGLGMNAPEVSMLTGSSVGIGLRHSTSMQSSL